MAVLGKKEYQHRVENDRISLVGTVPVLVLLTVAKAKDPDMEQVESVSNILGRNLNTVIFPGQLPELFFLKTQ